LRQRGLVVSRLKKQARKQQPRQLKKTRPLFGQLVADTKYLQDIPHYRPQVTRLRLLRFQYTVREPVSGLYFAGYAAFLVKQVSAHLAWAGLDLQRVTWQTDNGCEFQLNRQQQNLPVVVRALGRTHRFVPPKAHT
jgi:hypothetical protein